MIAGLKKRHQHIFVSIEDAHLQHLVMLLEASGAMVMVLTV